MDFRGLQASLDAQVHQAGMAKLDRRGMWACKAHLEVKDSPDPRDHRDRLEIREHPETGETPVKTEPRVVKVILERRETQEHLANRDYLDWPDKKERGDLPVPQGNKDQSD